MLITIKIQSQKILLLYGNGYQTYIRVHTDAQKFFFYLGRATSKVLEKQAWRLSDSKREHVFMLKNSYSKSGQWVIIWNNWINLKPNISV